MVEETKTVKKSTAGKVAGASEKKTSAVKRAKVAAEPAVWPFPEVEKAPVLKAAAGKKSVKEPKAAAPKDKAPAKKAGKTQAPKLAEKTPAEKTPAAKKTAEKKTAVKAEHKPVEKQAVAQPSAQERYRMVETAAYYIAERSGFSGCTTEYWAAAEIEIAKKLAG